MKITVLDADTLGKDLSLEPLKSVGEVTVYNYSTPDEVKERIVDCEVVIINKIKLNESNLTYAKNLKLICVFATGYDNIDLSYCREKGIAVCKVNAPLFVRFSEHIAAPHPSIVPRSAHNVLMYVPFEQSA